MRPGIDPEWTDEDQDKALAWLREDAKVCPNCRTRADLWASSPRDQPPYLGQMHHCPGCEALEQEQRNIPERAQNHTRAYLVPAHLAVPPDEE